MFPDCYATRPESLPPTSVELVHVVRPRNLRMILVVFFYNRGSLWTACGVLAISASASYNTLHLQIKVFLNSITAFFCSWDERIAASFAQRNVHAELHSQTKFHESNSGLGAIRLV